MRMRILNSFLHLVRIIIHNNVHYILLLTFCEIAYIQYLKYIAIKH